MDHLDREQLLQVEKALSREWLETNGLGAYASSTSLMCATRRYHGLLVAPLAGGVKRFAFLSRLDESLHGGDKGFWLSMARYPGIWEPHGYQSIESFDLLPYPSFRYQIGRATVLREVLMVRGQNTVLVRYCVTGQRVDVEARLRPLLPYRDADSLTFENLDLNPRVRRLEEGVSVRPYRTLPELFLSWSRREAEFLADPVWYRNIEYPKDLVRGYDGHEDQFSPGVLHLPVMEGEPFYLAASLDGPVGDPGVLWEVESRRRKEAWADPETASVRQKLEEAADTYLYEARGGRLGIVAGWPWFLEWGRDTFISLPGLTLARGDLAGCARVLEGVLPYLKGGLLPNIYGVDQNDSDYGSVDAALWFARAVQLYEQAGGSEEVLQERLYPALVEIAEFYRGGTDLGIVCDRGGLIAAGSEGLNATWMDAQTDEGPVTPRHGCAVEINALWYSLLHHLTLIAEGRGDQRAVKSWTKLRRRAKKSFLERFWIDDERYLGDCWLDGELDQSVRPNMVIAAALEYSPLTRGKRTDIVMRAEAELLVPLGLRTLSPKDPIYKGQYRGDQKARDNAYHQGTVWPWLLGFYCEAWLRAIRPGKRARTGFLELLDGFRTHLATHGINHISEVFDGDPPHRPGGTIAQAWSVAELLRAYQLLETFKQ